VARGTTERRVSDVRVSSYYYIPLYIRLYILLYIGALWHVALAIPKLSVSLVEERGGGVSRSGGGVPGSGGGGCHALGGVLERLLEAEVGGVRGAFVAREGGGWELSGGVAEVGCVCTPAGLQVC
jgi:hypothetical protein